MKKFIGILSVFLILATSVNLCSAARDVYVDVDSIVGWPEEFQASVTIGKKGRYVMSFVTQNGIIMCGAKGKRPGIVERGTPVYQLYQFCKAQVKSVYK